MEVKDCGCGKDHEFVPFEVDENGYRYELVCRTHKRHEPCRSCIHEKYVDVDTYTQREYRGALRAGLPISRLRELGGVE